MSRRLDNALLAARQKLAPAQWKQRLELSQFRRFTWPERLKILLGYNLHCHVALLTEHSPGRVAQTIRHTVTKAVDPESAIKEEVNL